MTDNAHIRKTFSKKAFDHITASAGVKVNGQDKEDVYDVLRSVASPIAKMWDGHEHKKTFSDAEARTKLFQPAAFYQWAHSVRGKMDLADAFKLALYMQEAFELILKGANVIVREYDRQLIQSRDVETVVGALKTLKHFQ